MAGALEDSQNNRRFIEIISEQSVRLARLTDDLLMLARIEAGKLELEKRGVSAMSLIQPCVEAVRMEAARKHIHVGVELAEDFPALYGDPDGLREVCRICWTMPSSTRLPMAA